MAPLPWPIFWFVVFVFPAAKKNQNGEAADKAIGRLLYTRISVKFLREMKRGGGNGTNVEWQP